MNQTSALQCRLYTPFIRFSNIVHSTAAFFFLALFCAGLLRAAPVDEAKAQVFAQRWLAAVDQPLGADFSAQSEIVSIVPITNSSGATIAYNVTLSPSGYVIISADDRLQPVITFSGNGSYADTPANPLRAFLQIDLQSRLAAVAQLAPEGPAVRGVDPVEPPPAVLENKSAWERFTGPATRADAAEVVAEVWVGSFVKSQWSQGGGIYNYYTPTIYDHSYTFQEPGNPDNIVCGCTATAMAQVMRYFQWPQKGVGVKQGSANITLRDTIVNPDPISITMNLRGGNGAGGPYNWDLMSLSPTGDEDLETLQQIGALCLDVGLSVGMNYNRENKSESAGSPSAGSYTNFFKYSGAGNPGGADGARANLDARRPVLVTAATVDLTTSHALFADGYGRIDGRWYYHLNLGWGGGANGWYNLEENVLFGGTPYQNQDGIAFGIGNIYRQRLQDNEKIDNAGRIISGRITDANGLPVAGVKVSIRKASQTPGEVWQRMLVWNEPIDPVATPVYKDWEGAAPGAGLYRHWTDANGIWAIDKVENGDYVIQLEKAGLEFLGTTDINVSGNRWGLNFVASPAGGLLSLQNWWYDGALLYLEFDRAIGNVLVNLGKIKVDNKNLLGSTVYQSDASNIMVIDTSTRFMPITIEDTSVVTIESGFLSIDVDGNNAYDGQDGINDLPSINAVEEKTNIAVGAAPADSAVTAITRVGASPQAGSEIKFTVSGTGLENITLQDFHLRVSSSGRRAVSVPSVSISAWDAGSGEITLQVGAGEGLIRVDYIPGSGGTPFLLGETCHVDNAGPAIIKAELDYNHYFNNRYITLTWNEPAGKNEDAETRKVADLPGIICYGGTPGEADFVVWRKERRLEAGNGEFDPPDAYGPVDEVLFGCENVASGTPGQTLDKILGEYNGELYEFGQFMYVDLNNNDVLDAQDMIFIKLNKQFLNLRPGPQPEYYFEPMFSPNDSDGYSVLGPTETPMPTSLVRAKPLKDASFRYYNPDGGPLPVWEMPEDWRHYERAEEFIAFFRDTWWAKLSTPGNGAWTDYAPANNDYQPGDTRLFGEAPLSGGAAGTFLTGSPYEDTLYFIDVCSNNDLDRRDLVWLDVGSVAGAYDDGDTVLSTYYYQPGTFSTKAGLTPDSLQVLLHTNGGIVENVSIDEITDKDGYPTSVAQQEMRVYLKYTPEYPDALGYDEFILAAGVEAIEIRPYANAVYDAFGNAASEGNTSGELPLYNGTHPRLLKAVVSYDNSSVMLQFNKRIYGNDQGILGNYLAIEDMMIEKIKDEDNFWTGNVTVYVIYNDNSSEWLDIESGPGAPRRDIVYQLGANYLEVRLHSTPENLQKLNMIDGYNGRMPVSLRISVDWIHDFEGKVLSEALVGSDARITVPLWPGFSPGYASLPPKMFSNAKGAYTQIALNAQQQALYVEAPAEGKPGIRLANTLPADSEQGVEDDGALEYYGVWYRDLDGDGRVDAVDLRFKNPYYLDESKYAKLHVNPDAIACFKVYVQNNDPEDFDDEENRYYPPDKEGVAWGNFAPWGAYPLSGQGRWDQYNSYLDFNQWPVNFRANWADIDIIGLEVIEPAGLGNREKYATLRLKLNQSEVAPRTHGDRLVMVTYAAPVYKNLAPTVGAPPVPDTYDGRIYGDKAPLKKFEGGNGGLPTDTEVGYWSNADEEAGIYWRYDRSNLGSAKHAGHVDAYFIVDSFGPVMAWDGAQPSLTSAVAWRATPYPKAGEDGLDGACGYEYFDLTFSEPIAWAADHALRSGNISSGYKDSPTFDGYMYGAWGATVIAPNTVRFKTADIWRTERFDFSGYLIDDSPGFYDRFAGFIIEGSNDGLKYDKYKYVTGAAVGVKPVDSRYRVLSQNDSVPMLKLKRLGGEYDVIKNQSWDPEKNTTNSSTFLQSVNRVSLKAIAQGGAYNNTSAYWLENGVDIGNATDTLLRTPGNAAEELLYSLRLNAQVQSPGASLYGAVNALTLRNDTLAGYLQAGQNYTVSPLSAFYAPAPLNRQTGQTTVSTPVRAMMSGPVYAMVKVSPCSQNAGSSSPIEPYNNIGSISSSRIVAGKYYPVLGIDAASSSAYTLTEVLLRFVDTSHGQFDPAVDLLPLADGAESGVLLVDENEGQIIRMALDGFEWSEWRINVEGLPYREIRLRPAAEVSLPTSGGAAQSFDFTVRIAASENLNLGDSFYVEIPDDGIKLGSYQSKDSKVATWDTPNGTKGYPFTDFRYNDRNGDNRWAAGDAISSAEDAQFVTPLHDGGHPYFTAAQSKRILSANGINVRNLYYAKKGGATNPESYPFYGQGGTTSAGIPGLEGIMDVIGSDVDLTYNVSYTPGDDVWYDIGGTPGVYDAGIDIPLFGNADKFPLPWSNSEVGARSAQMRGAAPANAIAAIELSSGFRPVAAPSNGPVAMVGLDMRDAGRGFGPRYILEGALLVETISKNITGGEYLLYYQAGANPSLRWKDADAAAVEIPAAAGERIILLDKAGKTFVVVRRLAGALPAADINIPFVVSADGDRDIQQPALITGVRVLAAGRGNTAGTASELQRTGTSLSWAGGAAVDVSAGGIFVLNPGRADYLVVEVTMPGGAGSEALEIYSSEGRAIAPFLNISGLEIMAVSDMVPQGFHTFSYNGAGALSWGNGAPAEISGPLTIVYGDGTHQDFPRNYVVVRRTAAALPAAAATDSLFINQTQLLRVAVTLRNVRGFTPTHITAIDDTENSGISLWWDANADGKFNAGDMFVKLLEKPVLQGSAGNYSCVLTPDPAWLTAWLSCPQDSSYATRGSNFFVCVNTTVDMSYGDQFSVRASFYEPSEPNYVTGGYCFATGSSGIVTCTSITNTAYRKLTHPGQTIDADTTVGLVSINHFMGADLGLSVYMTEVKLDVFGDSASFDPEEVFAPMDAGQVNRRGILLFVDSNDNGIFDPNTDRVIPCHINVSATAGKWTYTLIPEVIDDDVHVPGTSDTKPDHFLAVRLSEKLPFGISFSAGMNEDYVTYNTGVGNAASSIRTDILTSTISSKYQDLLDARMVSATTGLSINQIGSAVQSDYHRITFGYNPNNGHYTLSWAGYSVEIDISKVGTYTIGDEASGNFITVTFDPAAFFREDTLVASPSGRAPEGIKLGDKLVSLAGQASLTYFDANANGRYDHGETIVYNGTELLYGDAADLGFAVTAFSAADGLAFFPKDGNADFTWTAAADFDAIFHDSDGVYTLPWMALTVDVDNYITAGLGGAPGISEGTGLISAARVSLPANTDLTGTSTDYQLDSPLFLYFIKKFEDGLGYRHGEDIVVARPRAGTSSGALTLAAADKIVYDPAYMLLEDGEEYARPGNGATLHQFAAEDYLRFKANTLGTATYAQGQALFLSYNDTYQTPSFEWSIRVDKKRLIRRYNPLAMKPFDTAESALTALVGLDIANSGATDVKLTSLTVRFRNVSNFSTTDLRPLSTDVNSGVQLWRDIDGNGIFNPAIDKLVPLSGTPNWLNDGTDNYLTFSLAADNAISNAEVDGLYDFFVVVQPSESANSKQSVDNGDSFRVIIRNTDVVLNKTLNKSALITTAEITIDSKAPELVADIDGNTVFIADTDQDGYLERVLMTFHEDLQPGLFDDLSIWKFEDAETGASLTVTAAALSEDYRTVTLTLAGNDPGSSSGKLRLKAKYNQNAAILDWAGNPVELRIDAKITEDTSEISNYLLSSDTALPRIVHTGVTHSMAQYSAEHIVKGTDFYFRDRNGNGVWDAGENIWQGTAVYTADCMLIWNGGSIEQPAAWNTAAGYQGSGLNNLYFCDQNKDGKWNRNEFLWIDLGDTLETLGFYDEDVDIAVPLKRTDEIAVLDSDRDGRLDALRVYFSEALKDSTMDGYKATMDSFAAGKWSLVGRGNLTAWRQGLNEEYPDAQNNDLLYFSFAPSIAADTGTLPVLVLAAGETLADLEGNRLNGGAASAAGSLVLNDQAPPVLLEVVSSAKVEKAGADYVLPAGTTLTLQFSEDIFEYLQKPDLAGRCAGLELSVDGGVVWFALSDKLEAGSDLSVQGDCIVITFATATNGWPQTGVKFRLLAPADADSVFGDMVGHNPLPVDGMLVPSLDAPDPTHFATPLAGSYIRDNSDDLAVEVHWGDNPADPTPGTLRLYKGHAAAAEGVLAELPINDLSDLDEGDAGVDLTAWAEPGQYAYLLELTYVSGGTEKTISSAFFYAAEADIEEFALAVNDGPNIGEDIDQVLSSAGQLSANWEDFAAANGRPPAVKYAFAFAVEGEDPVAWTETAVTFGSKVINLSTETGEVYIAWVRAYAQNNVLIAQAYSDGVTIVDVLSDTKAPVIVYVNEGANQGVDIDESSVTTSLSYNLKIEDNADPGDVGIASYEVRLLRDSSVWSPDSSSKQLDAGRTGFASTTVNGQAWIIGGFDGNKALATINYTPLNQEGAWESREWAVLTTGSLNTGRSDFAFVKLQSGDLLAVGGSNGANSYYNSFEYFSMGSKTWTVLGSHDALKRAGAKAVEVSENVVWIIGGRNAGGPQGSIVEIDLGGAEPVVTILGIGLSEVRDKLQVTMQTRANGKKYLLAIGGKTGFGASTTVFDTVDVFDVAEETASTARLNTGRCQAALVTVPVAGAEEVWVLGGYGEGLACLDAVECIGVNGAITGKPAMSSPRAEFAALWLPESDSLLAVGGAVNSLGTATAGVEQFTCGAAAWKVLSPLTRTAGVVGHAMAKVGFGDLARLVVFGGVDGNYNFLKGTESRKLLEVVRDWQEVGLTVLADSVETTGSFTGLSLQDGATYYFQVRATDGEGNLSPITGSDGVLIDTALTRATIACNDIPAGGETAENQYLVTIGGDGVLSYKYRLLRDGAEVRAWSASWTNVSQNLSLELADFGVYRLEVIGKSASKEQSPADPTFVSWTVTVPKAIVAGGLPADGGNTYATAATVTVAGAGVREYKYQLDGGEWSQKFAVSSGIELSGLAVGEHTLSLLGYSFSNSQAVPTVHTWNVLATGLALAFVPSLPAENAQGMIVTASDHFEVQVQDPNNPEAGDLDFYIYELWLDGVKIGGAGDEAAGVAIAQAIALDDLVPGDYVLKVRAHTASTDTWQPLFTEQPFRVAVLGEASFVPDLAVADVDSYTVTVDLNGLTNYKYTLLKQLPNDGEEVSVPETVVPVASTDDLSFDLGPLEAGSYILKLWGGDGSASGIYQPDALEYALAVTQTTPIGDVLTVTLACGTELFQYNDGDTVEVTATFSEKLMAEPTAADFTLAGAQISSVEKTSDTSYKLTLAPVFAAGANQVLSTVRLDAGKVFGYFTGNGNQVSNKIEVLFYRQAIISLLVVAEPAEGIELNENVNIQVLVQSQDRFKGGDFVLKFDNTKFQLVVTDEMKLRDDDGNLLFDEKGTQRLDGKKILDNRFNQLATVADYVYDAADAIIGLRLAGAAMPGVDVSEPTAYAALSFQAVGAGVGADSDFALEAGQSGLLTGTYGLLEPDSPAIAYGKCQVPVEFVPAVLSIAFDPATVSEGTATDMVLNLSYPLGYNLQVTIKGVDYIIPENTSTVRFEVLPQADDALLNGDRPVVYTATAVNNNTHVTSLDGVEATVLVTDNEAALLSFSVVDPVSGAPVNTVAEGGKFHLKASLPDGVTASGAAKFSLNVSGSAIAGSDYAIGSNLIIAAGAGTGQVEITTYKDGIVDAGKTVTLAVTGVTVADRPASAFVAPEAITVTIENADTVAGDINDDGVVSIDDLLVFLNNWMLPVTAANENCDFNDDGKIDLDDLLILLNNWTPGGTRSGTRSGTREDAIANVNIRLQEKTGKTSVALNETVTIQAFVSTDWQGGIAGGRVDVNYTPGVLSFHGAFNHAEVVKNFTMVTQGTLHNIDGLIDDIGGTTNPAQGGLGYNTEVLFLEFTLDAATLGTGTATVSIGDDLNFSTLSGGPKTSDGTMSVSIENSLTFTITDPGAPTPEQPEFALAFETTFTAGTRASDKAELILGMLNGASFDITDPQDSPAGPEFGGVYYVAFDEEGRNKPLKWDFRGLSDAEVWNVIGRLPGGSRLELNWSLSLAGTDPDYSMPAYFDFFIVFPTGEEINMRTAADKYIEFTNEGEDDTDFEFAVKVVKHTAQVSHTYRLYGGWNLIGVPFALDENSHGLLADLEPMGYDTAAAVYVMDINQFVPGKAYWVYVRPELLTVAEVYIMTLHGTEVEDNAVQVGAGWNLCSPLYNSRQDNPTSVNIPTVWHWTPQGYRWLLPTQGATIGAGYWFYAETATEIWPVPVAP